MARVFVIPHALTAVTTNLIVPLGTVFCDSNGGLYARFYNAGAGTTAVGDVVGVYDSSGTTFGYGSVTAGTILDCSDGTTTRPNVMGIAISVVATTQYGWLQFGGYCSRSITTDGNVAKGNGLIAADGAILATPNTSAASAHWQQFGQALADDVSTTLSKSVLGGPGMYRWE